LAVLQEAEDLWLHGDDAVAPAQLAPIRVEGVILKQI
jgi:hypothetical protein